MISKKQNEIANILKDTWYCHIPYQGKRLAFEKLADKITYSKLIVDLACHAHLPPICDFFLNKIDDENMIIKILFNHQVNGWHRWSYRAIEKALSKIKNEQLLKKAIDEADSVSGFKLIVISLLTHMNILIELSLSDISIVRQWAIERIQYLRQRMKNSDQAHAEECC